MYNYLVRNVVSRQLAEHVVGELVDDAFSRLSAAAAGVLRLDADDRLQHLVRHVRLVPVGKRCVASYRCHSANSMYANA